MISLKELEENGKEQVPADQQENMNDNNNDGDLVDITSLIDECASSLTVSDPVLWNESTFSLHDSMSALEIMDHKMDCCQIPASAMPLHSDKEEPHNNNIMVPPRPLPTGLDDAYHPIPWEDLTMDHAAEICLQGLVRLESLTSGASVAESTYTCLYAHNAVLRDMQSRLFPEEESTLLPTALTQHFGKLLCHDNDETSASQPSTTLPQHLVYATVLGLVETSHAIRSLVLHADIYEEEDFTVTNYGLDFVSKDDAKETKECLRRTLEMIQDYDTSDGGGDDEESVSLAQHVLSFQLHLLTVCSSMAALDPEQVRKVTQETKSVAQLGCQHLMDAKRLVSTRKDKGSVAEKEVLRYCFDPYLYRPLVGNAPIRKVSFHAPAESIAILHDVLHQVDWACCDLLLHGTTLGQIRRILTRTSSCDVNILSRSMIVLNLYFDDKLLGQYNLVDAVQEDMVQQSAVPNTVLNGKYGRPFLNRLAKPIYDTLRLLVLNPCRQRGYMEMVMFQDWATLQQEARAVDLTDGDESPLPFFTHYVLATIAWLKDKHVALAVELQLVHGHHDLAVAVWYRDFLLSSLLNTRAAQRNAKQQSRPSEPPASVVPPKSRGKKKKAKSPIPKETPSATPVSVEDAMDDFDFAVLDLKRNLCRGLARFIAALRQANLLETETHEFTTHEIRFHQRYEALSLIPTPPALAYDDFRQGSDVSKVPQTDLLRSTAQCFKAGKATVDTLLEQLSRFDATSFSIREEDLRKLAKVCVGNSIFVMKLSQMVAGGQEAKGSVSFDFETDKEFCIIKIS